MLSIFNAPVIFVLPKFLFRFEGSRKSGHLPNRLGKLFEPFVETEDTGPGLSPASYECAGATSPTNRRIH